MCCIGRVLRRAGFLVDFNCFACLDLGHCMDLIRRLLNLAALLSLAVSLASIAMWTRKRLAPARRPPKQGGAIPGPGQIPAARITRYAHTIFSTLNRWTHRLTRSAPA